MSKRRIIIYISVAVAVLLIVGIGIFATQQSPINPDLLLSLGEKYLSELNYEQALIQFLKVIEIEPMNERAYIGAAKAYIGLGQMDNAIEILEQGLMVLPDSTEMTALHDELHLLLEYIQEPEQVYKPESISDPDNTSGSELAISVEIRGNSIGNTANYSYLAYSGEWIYYCNEIDDYSLYKIKTDGSNKTKLNDDVSFDINVIGDWVYYRDFRDDNNGGICKIRTDGSEKIKLSDDRAHSINIVDDWVYFNTDASDGNELYKMRTDGSEKTKIYERCNIYIVVDNWIYYSYNQRLGGSDGLYKISVDGVNKVKLTDGGGWCLNIVDDWIYYSADYLDDNKLYRMRTDGSERMLLYDKGCNFVNVDGDWIYFISDVSDGSKLCRVRTDGSEMVVLNEDEHGPNLYIVDDWIYNYSSDYSDGSDYRNLYKVRKDGSERQLVG